MSRKKSPESSEDEVENKEEQLPTGYVEKFTPEELSLVQNALKEGITLGVQQALAKTASSAKELLRSLREFNESTAGGEKHNE